MKPGVLNSVEIETLVPPIVVETHGKERRMRRYTLPDLEYDYGALEPHISGEAIEAHFEKHHAEYVRGANETLARLEESREAEDQSRRLALERDHASYVAGHALHSLFWRNLTPRAGGGPERHLRRALDFDFGGFERFRRQLSRAAAAVGSGWAALVWEPLSRRLVTASISDRQPTLNPGGIPIMVLDAWRHVRSRRKSTRRIGLIEAVWDVWNWEDIGRRFEAVRQARVAWAPRSRVPLMNEGWWRTEERQHGQDRISRTGRDGHTDGDSLAPCGA